MTTQLDINTVISLDQWDMFFDQFSERNIERQLSIETIDSESGNQLLVKDKPLIAIIYDRPGKGNNLTIELGKEEITYAHSILSPTEVVTSKNSHGVITAILITDHTGLQTLIKLQAIEDFSESASQNIPVSPH